MLISQTELKTTILKTFPIIRTILTTTYNQRNKIQYCITILFLSVAVGALNLYVSMLIYNSGRKQTTNSIIMVGIFAGLFMGFITDLMISLAGA